MIKDSFHVITEPEKLDEKAWYRFVEQHPSGNIFQTPYFYKVYRDTKSYRPFVLALLNQNDEFVGILQWVVQYFGGKLANKMFSRAVIWGGPLVLNNDERHAKEILKIYKGFVQHHAVFSQFRNLSNNDYLKDIIRDNGFQIYEHLNIHVELTKNEEQLWNEVHSKRRNEIRKAYKSGLTFHDETQLNALKESYEILKEVYANAKLPLAEFDFFEKLLKHTTDECGIKNFVAKSAGKIVGCMIALVYKEVIYDFYAGSYRDHYPKNPNDLIPWEVFKWGKANGFSLFDFGGAGKPNVKYGVRDYKKKFGGQLLNLGRYQIVHQPVKMKIAEIGFKAWQFIQGSRTSTQ